MEQLKFPVTKKEAEKRGLSYSSEMNRNALFPSRLRALRAQKGLSQEKVSKLLGMSKSTLGLYETGDTLPDAKTLYDMANYYGVSADYLLGLSDILSVEDNEETAASLGLPDFFVSLMKFINTNYTNDQLKKVQSVLASKHFETAIRSIGRLATLPIPSKSHPTGLDARKLREYINEIGDQIEQNSEQHYGVCPTSTIADGLIFRAQSSFAKAVEESYYQKSGN